MRRKTRGLGRGPATLFILWINLLFFTTSLPFFIPADSIAQDTVQIEVGGSGAIIDGNIAAGRDAAITDALRKAVEEATGAVISSDTATENFQVISDSIYTRSRGYVKGYEVLSETRSADLVDVRIRAVVSTTELKDDLDAIGLLQKKAGRPRVLFMVAEKGAGEMSYGFWWKEGGAPIVISESEAALKEVFLERGFNVADVKGSLEEGVSGALMHGELTAEGARLAGKRLNAEIVVFGKSLLQEGPSTGATSVSTYISEMLLQAVRVDDGALLATAKGRGVSKHITPSTGQSEAIARSAVIAADSLANQINSKWAGPHFIIVKLKGASYEKAVEFKKLLRFRVRGIEAVYQRSHKDNETYLEVETTEGAQAIADAITKMKGFKVIGFSSDTVEVEGAE